VQTAFSARLSYRQSCVERDDRRGSGRERWARVFPGRMVSQRSQPRHDSITFNLTDAHPDVEQMVPDFAIWNQIKPDTLHRRLSHSSAHVGSHLLFRESTMVPSTPRNSFSLISVSSFRLYPVSPTLHNTNTQQTVLRCSAIQYLYNMRQGRFPVVPLPRGVITPLPSPTRGSSSLEDSTDTAPLTTCIY
jgi:hypothetical protein